MLLSPTCLGNFVKFCSNKLETKFRGKTRNNMKFKVLTLSTVASVALLISACGGDTAKPANATNTNAKPANAAPTNAAPTNSAPTNAAPANADKKDDKAPANTSDKKDDKAPANTTGDKKDGDKKEGDNKTK